MDNQANDILTVEETALLLRIPRSSVYKLAQQGRIPAQKVGRHWRFYRPALVNWVAHTPNPYPAVPITNPEPRSTT